MGKMFQTNISIISRSGQNVSNNFVKIFNELYLFYMDFALCLTLDILASLFNAFFSLNSRARS